MNTHLKDEIFAVLAEEIATTPQRSTAPRPPRRSTRVLLTVAAAGLLVAGAMVISSLGDDPAKVTVTPAQDATTTTGELTSTTTVPYDVVPDSGYVLGAPQGTQWRVPSSWANDLMTPPPSYQPDPKTVSFKIAGTDERLTGITVSPSNVPLSIELESVGQIGDRELQRPANLSYPMGMTEENGTGPYMWTEADGSMWLTSGILSELQIALPSLSYEDGRMVLGSGLVPWTRPTETSTEVMRVRDSMFELSVTRDTSSDYSIVDPGDGVMSLIDINGAPGAVTTGGIAWRVDPSTVLVVARSLNRGMTPGPSIDEMIAAARAIRPATRSELQALKVWRGAETERVVVFTPADLQVRVPVYDADGQETGNTSPTLLIDDLDANDQDQPGGWAPQSSWASIGGALNIGPERIGHRLRLTIYGPRESEVPDSDGHAQPKACSQTVTVPPEGAPPVEVHLTAC